MAVRKPGAETLEQRLAALEQRVTTLEAENAATNRGLCHLAVKLPGGNAAIDRILQHEVGVSVADSERIIAAAKRT